MNAVAGAIVLAVSSLVGSSVQDKQNPEEVKVTADFDNVAVKEILDSFHVLTGVPIEMDEAATKKVDHITVSFKVSEATLVGALRLLLGPRGLEVKVVEKKKIVITAP
jgi:hypothetical protein